MSVFAGSGFGAAIDASIRSICFLQDIDSRSDGPQQSMATRCSPMDVCIPILAWSLSFDPGFELDLCRLDILSDSDAFNYAVSIHIHMGERLRNDPCRRRCLSKDCHSYAEAVATATAVRSVLRNALRTSSFNVIFTKPNLACKVGSRLESVVVRARTKSFRVVGQLKYTKAERLHRSKSFPARS